MVTPSVEQREASRLLPRLSLKKTLGVLTGGVLLAWLAKLAWDGYLIPRLLLAVLATLLLFQVLSVLFFLVAWLSALVTHGNAVETRQGNPFAEDQLPPQILPPTRNP